MKILLAGSSGFIGTALLKKLKDAGHEVTVLKRTNDNLQNAIYWDPQEGMPHPNSVEGFDAWINLIGENIGGRWTEEKKKKILESRKKGTQLLVETAMQLSKPPKIILNASAIGIYGTNRKGEKLKEGENSGDGFLAHVCEEWEKALEPAEDKGIRVVKLRLGIVLSPDGGALKKMLIPFKLGLGGPLGDGSQVMSWITLDDLIRVIQFCLVNDIHGPVNCVSLQPVTNKEFTDLLAKSLKRPAWVPVPAFLARFVLGEMADEVLLSSIYALPEKLSYSNFQFRHTTLEHAFKDFFIQRQNI